MVVLANRFNRRWLTRALGLAGAGAIGASVSPVTINVQAQPAAAAEGAHAPALAAPPTQAVALTADEMDAMHEAGVKAFPAATEGLGGQPLDFVLDGGVKVFNLVCQVVQWEYLPGKRVEAFAYNGVVPGPEIRVTEGDRVRIIVTNEMPQSTSVHWHGLVVPNAMDGVPFLTQPPIKPGTSFTYEFDIRDGNAGTHMYHSHHNSAAQVSKGLLGAFIVEPRLPGDRPMFNKEYTIVLNDGPIGGYSLNGKSFPATPVFTARKGDVVLFRMMNEGMMIHPMHLHGMPMTIIAEDGYLLAREYRCDTINIAPGQRFEALVHATELGAWAFHCHILSHAESEHGMFGMVSALIVEE